MRTLGRFVIGALGALCLVWLSAFAYGLLVQHLLLPRSSWRAHAAVVYGTEILAFAPFVVVIALLARRLFPRFPITGACACTLAAVAALFGPTAGASYRYDVLWNVLRINAEFILTFVIGVPLLVFMIGRWPKRPSIRESSRDATETL